MAENQPFFVHKLIIHPMPINTDAGEIVLAGRIRKYTRFDNSLALFSYDNNLWKDAELNIIHIPCKLIEISGWHRSTRTRKKLPVPSDIICPAVLKNILLCIAKYSPSIYLVDTGDREMIANHIHDALGQVRRLQSLILEKRKFTGYSGTARVLGGTVALLGCASMNHFRGSYTAQLIGWGCILAIALLLNYGAMLLWFIQLPARKRTAMTISPALDAVPPLAVGAVLTTSLLLKGQPDLLFGSWMCLYGLAHTVYRTALPKAIWYLGLYYLACGTFFLLWPGTTFMNPLPTGFVFLIGEWIGGFIFHRHKIEAMEDYEDD